ncbi:MAG: hypothetical protein JRJ44_05625 [Deltaproteobacteria bacterium]|nr:hypothetical protein [Deltaproteobacteria bacterium]
MKEEKQDIVEEELTDNDLEALDESMMKDINGGYWPIMMYGVFLPYSI